MSKGSRDRTKDRKRFEDNFERIFGKPKEKQKGGKCGKVAVN